MSKKYFLKKVSNYAMVGGLGSLLMVGFTGCEDRNAGNQGSGDTFTNASQKQGAFVIIEKSPDGNYAIVDEFPSSNTTIVLRENGKERILTQEEIDKLVKEEAAKIDNGTSNLTSGTSMGGMGLGEALLASAAGAIIGSFIGNKLFGNQNYQNNRRASYKSPSTYSKSVNSFNKAKSSSSSKSTSSSSSKKSGYFGNSKSSSSSKSSFGG